MSSDDEIDDNYDDDDYYGDGNDSDYVESDNDEVAVITAKIQFEILTEADVSKAMGHVAADVSSFLSVGAEAASTVLRYYNWDVEKLREDWVEGGPVHEMVRMLEARKIPKETRVFCKICFEDYNPADTMSASCGAHHYCNGCWGEYVRVATEGGPGCLTLRCPDPACRAVVTDTTMGALATGPVRAGLEHHRLYGYVYSSRVLKWCPSPGCSFLVKLNRGEGANGVACRCGHFFCFACGAAGHSPVDCRTAGAWLDMVETDGGAVEWITKNARPCPKCKKAIEKDHGCMHMTCLPPCKHEFCWLCLGPWEKHGKHTGGFYNCNKYIESRHNDGKDTEREESERAMMYLDKYTHYYTRYVENKRSKERAVEALEGYKREEKLELVQKVQGETAGQMEAIVEAWRRIIECRRVLQWSYVYGYYMFDREEDKDKKAFFEDSQGVAESALEKLHNCAEKDFEVFVHTTERKEEFREFRERITHLELVARRYFDRFVKELENECNL